MANKFLTNINLTAGLEADGDSGSAGQILSSTGTGVEWIEQSAITSGSNLVFFNVKNETGSTILKGKGVMAVGTDGNSGHILIDEMVGNGSIETKYFLGILEEDIPNGGFARVIHFGEIDQLNTTGQNGETWSDGQVLWCDPVNAGDFTITEPDGPNVKIAAAIILNSSTNGKIQVRVQGNEGIHDLYDTKITSQVDGDVLVWDNTTGVWFNDSTLNVDYTQGNVGIGTTSPGTKLDVSGVITAAGGNSTEWNAAYGDKINSASFNTSTGFLTLNRQDLGSINVNLDNRYQLLGTYNTIIGTDDDINTSGSTIIDNINVTDGVITSMGTRTLTLGDLGYTGDTNAEVNQNTFSNIAVSGQTTVSADSKTDTLNLAAGSNITITTDAATDTVTIASSASGGSGGSGGSIDIVATGQINNGAVVALRSDGTVEVIQESTIASQTGTEATYKTTGVGFGDIDGTSTTRLDDNRFVVFYYDHNFPNDYIANVGTVSGTTITFGSDVVVYSGTGASVVSCCTIGTDKIAVSYRKDTNPDRMGFKVGIVVGNGITFGAEYESTNYVAGFQTRMIGIRDNEFLSFHGTGASPFVCYLEYFSVSGTTITLEDSDGSTYLREDIDLALLSEGVVALTSASGSTCQVGIIEANNGTLTSNTPSTYSSGTGISDERIVRINDTTFAVFYRLTSNNYGYYRVGTVSGGTIVYQSQVQWRSSSTYYVDVENVKDDEFVLIYRVLNSNHVARRCTVSGTTITLGTEETFKTSNTVYQFLTHLGGSRMIVTFCDFTSTDAGKVIYYKAESSESNYIDFIGIAEEAIADTETGKITILGGVNESQSGLTANTKYYVDGTGNLTTTAENNVYVGVAISSTEIIVKN